MSFNPVKAFNYLKELSYSRFTGSPGEISARDYIKRRFEEFGYHPILEYFDIKTYNILKSKIEIIEPYFGEIPCFGLGFSGSTPDEGIEDILVYVENADKILLPYDEGFIYLMSARPNFSTWKFLTKKKKPSAILIAESNPYRDLSHVAIPYEWRKFGTIPSLYIKFDEAVRIVRSGVNKVRVMLVQEIKDTKSYNIIAEKRGYKYPDEIIVVGGHYDTVYGVPGSFDNAGGTAFVLELARVFSKMKTKRTLLFILFAGEEMGLRGSRAYLEQHKEDIENIKLMVNLDVHGACIGTTSSIITGFADLKNYVEALTKEYGIKMNVREDIMSSDGTSFAKYGVPAVNFFRSSGAGSDMHTIYDNERYMGATGYKLLGIIVQKFIEKVANAEELPFKREIPENLKKKVKEYFSERLGID